FFFQAEDGIRDFHVTGVQTCALPIFFRQDRLRGLLVPHLPHHRGDALPPQEGTGPPAPLAHHQFEPVAPGAHDDGLQHAVELDRSEERRVGKECTARVAWYEEYTRSE